MSEKLTESFNKLQKAIEQLPAEHQREAIEKLEVMTQGIVVGILAIAPTRKG